MKIGGFPDLSVSRPAKYRLLLLISFLMAIGGGDAVNAQSENTTKTKPYWPWSIDVEIRSKQELKRTVGECLKSIGFISVMESEARGNTIILRADIFNVSDVVISGLVLHGTSEDLISSGYKNLGKIRFPPLSPGAKTQWTLIWHERRGKFPVGANHGVGAIDFLDVAGVRVMRRYASGFFSERDDDREALDTLLKDRCRAWDAHKDLFWYGD